jgi:hypothetical protein
MRARVEIIKDFLSKDEMAQLNAWASLAVNKCWLDASTTAAINRLTTRMYGDRFETPPVALEVFAKIRQRIKLGNAPLIEGHGRDGIVVSYTYPEGSVSPHYDPPTPQGAALRCNIITQAADAGGELYVDGERVFVGVGDLHCYAVSAWQHSVSRVMGTTPRILWMFGVGVDLAEWENGKLECQT